MSNLLPMLRDDLPAGAEAVPESEWKPNEESPHTSGDDRQKQVQPVRGRLPFLRHRVARPAWSFHRLRYVLRHLHDHRLRENRWWRRSVLPVRGRSVRRPRGQGAGGVPGRPLLLGNRAGVVVESRGALRMGSRRPLLRGGHLAVLACGVTPLRLRTRSKPLSRRGSTGPSSGRADRRGVALHEVRTPCRTTVVGEASRASAISVSDGRCTCGTHGRPQAKALSDSEARFRAFVRPPRTHRSVPAAERAGPWRRPTA